MKRKFGIALFAVAACVLMLGSAYAFGGLVQGNEAMQQALQNNNYEAFLNAGCERVNERMTEERFGQMAERFSSKQAVRGAIENSDFDAWVEAVESKPGITDIVTEENFETFVAMHEARQSGDLETAKQLAEELGIPAMQGKGFGRGFGQRKGGMHSRGPLPQ